MNINDIKFEPFSDTGINELEKIEAHKVHIKNEEYEDAATIAINTGKGFTASFLNSVQNKIQKFGTTFLNDFSTEELEYVTSKDPDNVDLPDGCKILVQIL